MAAQVATGGPVGSECFSSDSGWMTRELLVKWLGKGNIKSEAKAGRM